MKQNERDRQRKKWLKEYLEFAVDIVVCELVERGLLVDETGELCTLPVGSNSRWRFKPGNEAHAGGYDYLAFLGETAEEDPGKIAGYRKMARMLRT